MTLGTLLDVRFKAALGKLQSANLPLKVAFKLRGVVKAIEKELATYEETRQAALQKYGQKGEDGKLLTNEDEIKSVKFESEEMFKKFLEELGELSKVEVEIPKIAVADIENAVHLSADDLAQLENLLHL
jgi:hypothetical protein